MFMQKEDRDELREMMTDILGTHSAKSDGKFNLIKQQLNNIELQTTKTNGRMSKVESRVTKIETNDEAHINRCPQEDRFKKLEDESITSKGIKKFLYGSLVVISIIVGIVIGVLKLFSGV